MNIYNEFAKVYDELMWDYNYKEWYQYIEFIFQKYNKNPDKILEMACGTGNLTYYLAKAGYNLTAFDISSEMLAKAYEKLQPFKNTKLLNQNMVDFQLRDSFQAIISICDSVNYIIHREDLYKTFLNVYKHLEEGGIFIFDINSYYKLKHIIGNNTFVEDRENLFYIWQNYYDEIEDICEFYLTFFYSEDNIKFVRFDEEHREKAYKNHEITSMLEKVGFTQISIYEGFTLDKPQENSERINFVAIK